MSITTIAVTKPVGSGIIELGSNSYGEYALFGNGIVICWGTAIPYSWDGTYLIFRVTSPYEFADLTYGVGWSLALGSSMTFHLHNNILHASTTRFDLIFYKNIGTYTQTNLSFIAIGRAAV